jgi:hypothetical protein
MGGARIGLPLPRAWFELDAGKSADANALTVSKNDLIDGGMFTTNETRQIIYQQGGDNPIKLLSAAEHYSTQLR